MSSLSDAFTADEIARASGVPREAIDELVDSGDLRPARGTSFFAAEDAIRAGRQAREIARRLADPRCQIDCGLSTISGELPAALGRRRTLPTFAASCAQATLVVLMIWLASRPAETAAVVPKHQASRLVFLALPGEGGGGGGGGLKNPLPPPRLERRAPRPAPSVPAVSPEPVLLTARHVEVKTPVPPPLPKPNPEPRAQEPLAAHVLIAPVAASGREREREGEIEAPDRNTTSLGSGTGSGAGSGQGAGNGPGNGAGIGPGSGGGTGGGPYRPGSGITPPRLLKEVKALYTEEARRRGIIGDVVLEIVVTRDGSVGNVSVLRGLGSGLEQRAIDAVRQWRFSPAQRKGEPVDVIVEVAVEFSLR